MRLLLFIKQRIIPVCTGITISVIILLVSVLSLSGLVVSAEATALVDINLSPSTECTAIGQIFTVDITFDAIMQEVDTIGVYVNFDPEYLQVVDTNDDIIESSEDNIIVAGSVTTTFLTTKLKNRVDNNLGTADISYGMPPGGNPANDAFVLGAIRFKAVKATSSTTITFNTSGLRTTMAARNFSDVTGTLNSASLEILSSFPGDVNKDGTVNATDITSVIRMILELDPEIPEADVNKDGNINVLDITKIVRMILGLD